MSQYPYRRLIAEVETAINHSNRGSKAASPDELAALQAKLVEAIATIEKSGWAEVVRKRTGNLPERQGVAAVWANCLGMLAGHHRRLGTAELALPLLEHGAKLELDPEFNIMSTYCAVNRIAMLIELMRSNPVDLSAEIAETIAKLKRQTVAGGSRASDPWAFADLGQLQLLGGDGPAASEAYDNFVLFAKKGDEVDSAIRVLRLLQSALDTMRADAAGEDVRNGITYLLSRRINRFGPSR